MEMTWTADYWHWWVLAGVLLFIEVLVSGFFFLWLAAAAGVVGVVMLLIPGLAWEYQLMIFAGGSVASIVAFKLYQRAHPPTSDQPSLNRRGEQYVGRHFTLDTPIVDGVGSLRVDDTTWRIMGGDLPAGEKVQVIGVDGVMLKVELVA